MTSRFWGAGQSALSYPLGVGLAFTPARLFIGGGAGGWWDPSDLSTMFKDTAGTQPVTADGDAVARINDKSGNGNHLVQATTANCPTFRKVGAICYLDFDGTDDCLSLASANLAIVGDLTLSASAYKNAGGSYGGLLTCQTNAGTVNPYEFRFSNHATVAQPELIAANATTAESTMAGGPGNVGPLAAALVASMRRSVASSVELSVNKSRVSYASTMTPTADASSTFTMGNRHGDLGIPLAGRIYGAVAIAGRLSDANLGNLETWLGAKAGLSI